MLVWNLFIYLFIFVWCGIFNSCVTAYGTNVFVIDVT